MLTIIKKIINGLSNTLSIPRSQKELNIISFLKEDKYFQKDIPANCYNNHSIIADNENLFEIVIMPRKQEIKLKKIFRTNIGSDFGGSRNFIFTFSESNTFEDKSVKGNITFNGVKIEKLWNMIFNVAQYSFNNEMVYCISVTAPQDTSTRAKKQDREFWLFLVKKNDLEKFFIFCEKQIFTFKTPQAKIKNTLKTF